MICQKKTNQPPTLSTNILGMSTLKLNDYLYSINQSKKDIWNEEEKKNYVPYVINKCLAGQLDSVLHANEMNASAHLDKRLQYDYYINTLRPRKRFSPWLKKSALDDLDAVKTYYGYSNEKARQALQVLTTSQLKEIRSLIDTGGSK